mgnify:FL=1|jgi:hypothetical protein
MSEKQNYKIEIEVYGPDSWFDPHSVALNGGLHDDDIWKTFEFIFDGSEEEMESFVDDKLDEIDAACGGRGSLNYDLYVEEV